MTILLPALGIAFAAFCVWLTVRIVNRRERWAKWTALAIVGVALYALSAGPVVWLANHGYLPQRVFQTGYYPLAVLSGVGGSDDATPGPLAEPIDWYIDLWQ